MTVLLHIGCFLTAGLVGLIGVLAFGIYRCTQTQRHFDQAFRPSLKFYQQEGHRLLEELRQEMNPVRKKELEQQLDEVIARSCSVLREANQYLARRGKVVPSLDN